MATVTYFLDTRKSDSGFGIIKIRVTHNRVQRDYSTKLKVEVKAFDKIKKSGETLDGRIKEPLLSYYLISTERKSKQPLITTICKEAQKIK